MLNKIQCEDYFLNLLRQVALDQDLEDFFKRMGVDFHSWPNSPIKNKALEYLAIKETKGRAAAAVNIAQELKDAPIQTTPQDPDIFKAEYDETLATWTGILIADQLRQNPKEWEKAVSRFKQTGTTEVKVYDFAEYCGEVISGHLKNPTEGDVRVVIPRWDCLSQDIGGFNPKRVNILVAQTGVGKTLWALNVALCAIEKFPVLFFNMEMGISDLMARMIQSEGGVSVDEWNHRKETIYPKTLNLIDRISHKHKLLVTDGKALSLNKLIATIYQQHEKNQIKMVFVDYDQKILMPGFDEEWRALLKGLMALEEVAKELDLNIWVLAQGDEKGDPKASKRAMQPASAILHLEKNSNGDGFILTGKKNRFGKNGFQVSLLFQESTLKVSELGPHVAATPKKTIIEKALANMKNNPKGRSEEWYEK